LSVLETCEFYLVYYFISDSFIGVPVDFL